MNQSNSAGLCNFPDDLCLDIQDVSDTHRALNGAVDGVSVPAIFKGSTSKKNTNFDPKWKEAAMDLQAKLDEACDQLTKQWLVQNGYGNGRDCRLRVHSEHRVSVKPTVGSGNAFNAIIHTILSREGALGTQTFIRAKAKEMYPNASVTKNWNQALQPWAIRNVMARVAGLGAPFDSIKLKRGATLNDLHAASKTAVEKFKGGAQSFTSKILLSDTHLIVNGVPFVVSKNKSGGKEYQCFRISKLKLEDALATR